MTKKDYILLANIFRDVRKNVALDTFTIAHIEGYFASVLKSNNERFDISKWLNHIDGEGK